MSGIHGIFRFDGPPVRPDEIQRQSNALAGRGPDRRNSWCTGPVGVGHALLSVTAEDAFEVQPAHGARHTLVADLRLDNRDELAAKLSIAAPVLSNLSDSGLLLKSYERWGEHCVDHLVGDFAFAVWDDQAHKLVLARDPMGQRNVFFHHDKHAFVFASDLKGLWAVPHVPKDLSDLEFARAVLADGERRGGATMFEGLYGLTGGTVLTVDGKGTITTRCYWTPHADPVHLGKSESYYIEAYRSILAEAVACRIRRTTRPAGLLLGGGFDSGAIAGLAGPTVTAQARELIAVSSVLPDNYTGPLQDVRRWTRMIARDMPHIDMRYVSREGTDLLSGMEAEFLQRDSPFSPNSVAVTQIYATLAAAGARVVMNGYGGDYTLNPRVTGWLARLLRRKEFRRFAFEFRAYLQQHKVSVGAAIRRELVAPAIPGTVDLFRRLRAGLPVFRIATPLAKEYLRESVAAGAAPRRRISFSLDQQTWPRMTLQLLRQQALPAMGSAQHAASFGLELTQPYHDKRVVELALAIPEAFQAKDGRSRHLARQTLKGIYPREFQVRDSQNDDMTPEMEILIERAVPTMLQDIARMKKSERLTRYFDFDRMQSLLIASGASKAARGVFLRKALRSYTFARYLDWMRRDNNAPPI